MNILARIALALFVLCYFPGAAAAQEVITGQGLICDTPEQVAEYAAHFTGDNAAALKKVNAEKPVCTILAVAFVRGEDVKVVSTKNGLAVIAKIAVIAVNTGIRWIRGTKPLIQFTLFTVKGRDT